MRQRENAGYDVAGLEAASDLFHPIFGISVRDEKYLIILSNDVQPNETSDLILIGLVNHTQE